MVPELEELGDEHLISGGCLVRSFFWGGVRCL